MGRRARLPDTDPVETGEWLEALRDVAGNSGVSRARILLHEILGEASDLGVPISPISRTPYLNTIPRESEGSYPGDEALEIEFQNHVLWNAAAIVSDANRRVDGIGGHISTYASSSTLYEVGFNHVFRGKEGGIGDAIYIQGHGSPGIYARAFLEGRLDRGMLKKFRQEAWGGGLSSYPHPRLMPDFWEYPTVSMGLGPLAAVMQAKFWKYLHNRGLADTSQSRVFSFLGDGEMDEPESIASIAVAGRERLDNLIVVVNCNLQRLDGPVRGNAKIIQELEGLYRGAGWEVIKVLWNEAWDGLLRRHGNVLLERLEDITDGDFQRMSTLDSQEFRSEFFSGSAELEKIGSSLSDEEISSLGRGGHDRRKVLAAYRAAEKSDRPAVILAHTVKGWGIESFLARNSTHQKKKMDRESLLAYRDHLGVEISDDMVEHDPFVGLSSDSRALAYANDRRSSLGGPLPSRSPSPMGLEMPESSVFSEFDSGTPEKQKVSTTMVFVRLLRSLMKSVIGKRVVPVIPDEGRTFGMDPLFSEFGIFSLGGQKYTPVDHAMLMNYKESESGQILQEGISEAGAMATWTAAATSYAHSGVGSIPFYIFYSMFGFQRVADQVWAAADARARGFLMGATAGRTTLNGEGLQHQDGHSLLLASTVPSVRAWDPAYAYELATIIRYGIREMVVDEKDMIHYVMLYNDNESQPQKPEGCDDGIIRGAYVIKKPVEETGPLVRLLGSGPILKNVVEASEKLRGYGVRTEIWSVTSYGELRREGIEVERMKRLNPSDDTEPYVVSCFGDDVPTVAASDYIAAVPEMIQRWVGGSFCVLGTDGYGRSDTRAALRKFFEIDADSIVIGALSLLEKDGIMGSGTVASAIETMGVNPERFDVTV
ncbi:MAG TPA: pyruvate dehydrogenase (acetyl-transferring), homodimeric type [Candidatus Thalassarchaeaceae archaeon]|nr:pyruvate dehydrogenase (acetyl-transferring), homodimeric type [Euryarchaeota archaeon]DAC42764.1 MAG TPA: pyruvate dehydrogenase (acetyl-transferring), homodimeric type [Candidatus Poseidoniales archaeon]HII90422.1 pyruvate dehydrogenase (acetyl-transferring), homodimeric type [Candidatus Thalassarchaeaceae archaeon]|tara:strand:+ start:1461 stop:4103 length:2643 start_codon:yes stop_codon:yes gene_type:complete